MAKATCETCRFHVHMRSGFGTCHRFPPVAKLDHIEGARHRTLWALPAVNSHDDWCGEHRPKDKETDG